MSRPDNVGRMFQGSLDIDIQNGLEFGVFTEEKPDPSQNYIDRLKPLAELSDWEFDQLFFDDKARRLSEVHWTPVRVAKRAAELLSGGPKSRILDVGSGAGKFCLVGALSTDAQFFGVERRQALADYSRSLIKRQGVPRVSIIDGDASDLDWGLFDGIYLFNPFYENLVDVIRFEPLVELSLDRFNEYVRITRTKLRDLKPGTRVVTYHGFGGELPCGYRLDQEYRFSRGTLQLWIKEAAHVNLEISPIVWQEPG